MSDVRFIRVRGRVVPIRKKEKTNKYASASAKISSGVAIGALTSKAGLTDLKKSWFSYNKSSDFKAMMKLVKRGSTKRNELRTTSAAFKVLGKGFSKRGNLKIKFGLTLGGLAVGSGISDLFKGTKARDYGDEVSGVFAAGLTAASISLIGRKFKVRAKDLSGLNSELSLRGKRMASEKFLKVASSGLGVSKKKGFQYKFDL